MENLSLKFIPDLLLTFGTQMLFGSVENREQTATCRQFFWPAVNSGLPFLECRSISMSHHSQSFINTPTLKNGHSYRVHGC
jgi:hypothetical protein